MLPTCLAISDCGLYCATRFLIIALGGIVPFLSFFTEKYFAKVAEADLKKVV
ncbi:MAG: hypothetical protein RL716_616 [Actinomycetota bacterium]